MFYLFNNIANYLSFYLLTPIKEKEACSFCCSLALYYKVLDFVFLVFLVISCWHLYPDVLITYKTTLFVLFYTPKTKIISITFLLYCFISGDIRQGWGHTLQEEKIIKQGQLLLKQAELFGGLKLKFIKVSM